jgi:hypothetical protein
MSLAERALIIAAISALLLCNWTIVVRADTEDLAFARSMAAFQCAVLAVESHARLGAGEAERLSMYGHEQAKLASSRISEMWKRGLPEEYGRLSKTVEPAFWIGMLFMSANVNIGDLLQKTVPFRAGASYEQISSERASFAVTEFNKRNCGLLGK